MAAFGTPMVKMGSLDPGSMTPDGRGVLTPNHEKPDTVPRKVPQREAPPPEPSLWNTCRWEPYARKTSSTSETKSTSVHPGGGEVRAESAVLRLRAPTKIFGDLHGQYGDLAPLCRVRKPEHGW